MRRILWTIAAAAIPFMVCLIPGHVAMGLGSWVVVFLVSVILATVVCFEENNENHV